MSAGRNSGCRSSDTMRRFPHFIRVLPRDLDPIFVELLGTVFAEHKQNLTARKCVTNQTSMQVILILTVWQLNLATKLYAKDPCEIGSKSQRQGGL